MLISKEYLAGYIDGEGSFFIYLSKGRNKQYIRCGIQISTAFKDIIELIKENYGGYICTISTYNSITKKKIFKYQIIGKAAANLTYDIIPFLIEKREQADLLLEFQNWRNEQPRNANWSKIYWMIDEMKMLKH